MLGGIEPPTYAGYVVYSHTLTIETSTRFAGILTPPFPRLHHPYGRWPETKLVELDGIEPSSGYGLPKRVFATYQSNSLDFRIMLTQKL